MSVATGTLDGDQPKPFEAQPPRSPLANQKGHRPDIQGLRAVAVLLVVLFHAGLPFPGGFVGVDVFFVISGFVITAMLMREWGASGRVNFRRFYIRRFTRLIPALSLTVVATLLLTAAVVSPLGPQDVAAKTAIGAMLLSSNVIIGITTGDYFGSSAEVNPLLNMWSLSVEEQFYLGFPALLVLVLVMSRRFAWARRAPIFVLAVVLVVSFATTFVDTTTFYIPGAEAMFGFYSPMLRVWEFLIGCLLALLPTAAVISSRRTATLVGALGLLCLGISVWAISAGTPFPGPWTVLPVAATAFLLIAGTRPANPVSRLLSTKPFVTIGDWSYSLYLWHWPMIVFASLMWPGRPWVPVAAAAASVFPAVASYRWLENPIRHANLRGKQLATLAAAALLLPLGLAAVILAANQAGYWSSEVARYQDSQALHIGAQAGCHTGIPITQRDAAKCTWHSDAGGLPIYLVGDSHADQFGEAVVGAAEASGHPVTLITWNNCPFFDVYISKVDDRNAIYRHCSSVYPATMTWLSAQRPGIVVIASTNSPYRDPTVTLGPSVAEASRDEARKVEHYEDGMKNTVTELQDMGHRVLLIQDTPRFTDGHTYAPTECSIRSVTTGACDAVVPLEVVDKDAAARAALDAVAQQTGATILDLTDTLCTPAGCPSRVGDTILYRDNGHISVSGSAMLVEKFAAAMTWLTS